MTRALLVRIHRELKTAAENWGADRLTHRLHSRLEETRGWLAGSPDACTAAAPGEERGDFPLAAENVPQVYRMCAPSSSLRNAAEQGGASRAGGRAVTSSDVPSVPPRIDAFERGQAGSSVEPACCPGAAGRAGARRAARGRAAGRAV
eukprot:8952886-Pyramimonas_sp.AAC.1